MDGRKRGGNAVKGGKAVVTGWSQNRTRRKLIRPVLGRLERLGKEEEKEFFQGGAFPKLKSVPKRRRTETQRM